VLPPSVRPGFETRLGSERILARVKVDGDTRIGVLLRGELSTPLIRIDDYPTGVRPIAGDLAPLHEVLAQFESRELPYWLGIVPGILDPSMLDFLASLRFMVPVQHGYDHGYPRLSARLLRKGDPHNQRGTVGSVNEFRFQMYRTIRRKLSAGRELLERHLGRPVRAYIPPCNRCDRGTAKALASLGFELCLSDRPVPEGYLPVLGSDFYGRSPEAVIDPAMEVLCLHATWERDVREQGDLQSLPLFIERGLAIAEHKRAAIERLALAMES
jgi:hypothetical protein